MSLLFLKNAQVADGSGTPFYPANILIDGDKIAAVGPVDCPPEATEINCSGQVVSPGFIDAHSHSDLQVLDPQRTEKSRQGVTSEVVGNCGFSPYPCGDEQALHEFANGILFGGAHWGWRKAADYLLETQARARLASVASLVGHGSLRIAHAGNAHGALPETTLSAMEATLDESLADGATGFSTGLMYAPGASAPTDELIRLCRVVAKRDKIYCTHIRDYSTHLLEAIDEQIELARNSGCRLQISHLQTVGRVNWYRNDLALEKIEQARQNGIDVMFDCYPYLAGSTVLTQMLPQWALEGGTSGLLERLQDPATRRRLTDAILQSMVHQWSDIFISGVQSEANAHLVGQNLEEISKLRSESPTDVIFNLLVEEKGAVNMLQFNQSEENLRRNLAHPLSIVISDGFYVKGRPHPRLHGTFPELLGRICRENHWLTLAGALHKVTGKPADRFQIRQRGFIRPGYFADLAIFDANAIQSQSTYANPEGKPVGISHVIRNGQLI
jgi:dihydroorotase/N-acyl-D-amino-acid deacylase